MPKVYLVSQYNLTDSERFGLYVKGAQPLHPTYGAKLLASGATTPTVEGSLATGRITITEFPSREAFEAFYTSPEYAAIKHLRHEATSDGSVVILDEWERPAI